MVSQQNLKVSVFALIFVTAFVLCYFLVKPISNDFNPRSSLSFIRLSSLTTAQSSQESPRTPFNNASSSKPSPIAQRKDKYKWIWMWAEKNAILWGETAYIDTRTNIYNDTVIIALGHRESRSWLRNYNFTWYCHVETESTGSSVCTGQASLDNEVEGIGWRFHSFATAAYYICHLPPDDGSSDSVMSVSFSPHSCNSTVRTPPVPIKQIEITPRKTLGICLHKALFGVQDIQPLVEFIEMHRLLGVELFTIYIQQVSQNVLKILSEYSSKGIVDLVNWKVNVSWQEIRDYGQVGVIHECLLRNKGRVKYLGFSDFDEVFVPRQHNSLVELLSSLDKPQYGSFRFLHVFMHGENQQSSQPNSTYDPLCPQLRYPLYFRRYVRSDYRDSSAYNGNTLGSKAKVFVKPEGIIRMGRHSMHLRHTHKFAPGYEELTVPGEMGLLFHYRRKLQRGLEKRPPVKDLTLSKYTDRLIKVLKKNICRV